MGVSSRFGQWPTFHIWILHSQMLTAAEVVHRTTNATLCADRHSTLNSDRALTFFLGSTGLFNIDFGRGLVCVWHCFDVILVCLFLEITAINTCITTSYILLNFESICAGHRIEVSPGYYPWTFLRLHKNLHPEIRSKKAFAMLPEIARFRLKSSGQEYSVGI